MNKRRLFRGLFGLQGYSTGAFIVCGAMFAAGVILGSVQSSGFCESGAAADFMGPYLEGLTSQASAPGQLISSIGVCFYPAAAFLMGFSILGTAGIPLLTLARGFAAGFSLSVFVRLYSGSGVVMGLLLVGLQTALSVPLFLPVAARALSASFSLSRLGLMSAPPQGGIYTRAYFLRFFAALILMLLLCAGGRALACRVLAKLPAFF